MVEVFMSVQMSILIRALLTLRDILSSAQFSSQSISNSSYCWLLKLHKYTQACPSMCLLVITEFSFHNICHCLPKLYMYAQAYTGTLIEK